MRQHWAFWQSNMGWKHQIQIRPPPPLACLPFFPPPAPSPFFLSFPGPMEVVFCCIYIFSDRKDKQRPRPERMWVAFRPCEHTSLCIQGLTPGYHLTTLLYAWKRHFSICCLYTDNSLEKHLRKGKKKKESKEKLEQPKLFTAMVETMLIRLHSLSGHLSDNLARKQNFHFSASSI